MIDLLIQKKTHNSANKQMAILPIMINFLLKKDLRVRWGSPHTGGDAAEREAPKGRALADWHVAAVSGEIGVMKYV